MGSTSAGIMHKYLLLSHPLSRSFSHVHRVYANPVNQLMCAAGAYKNRYKLLIQNNAKAGEKKAAEKKTIDRAAEKKTLRKAQTSFICPTIFYSFLFRYGVFFSCLFVFRDLLFIKMLAI